MSCAIHPDQCGTQWARDERCPDIGQRPVGGHAEMSGAGYVDGIRHTFNQRHRPADDLNSRGVEPDSVQYSVQRVHEMPGQYVARVAANVDQDATLTGLERLGDNLRLIPVLHAIWS